MATIGKAYLDLIKRAHDAVTPIAPEKCDSCGAFDEDQPGRCAYCRQPKRQAAPVPTSVTVEQDVREIYSWGGEVFRTVPRRTVTVEF